MTDPFDLLAKVAGPGGPVSGPAPVDAVARCPACDRLYHPAARVVCTMPRCPVVPAKPA